MTAVPEAEGGDPVGGKLVRPVSLGVLHRNAGYPHLYWQNFLSLDPARVVSADVLIAEADRLFADLPIRHVLVADAEAAERVRPGLLQGGYREAVHLTMVLRRPFDRQPQPPSSSRSALRTSAPPSRHICERGLGTRTPSASSPS